MSVQVTLVLHLYNSSIQPETWEAFKDISFHALCWRLHMYIAAEIGPSRFSDLYPAGKTNNLYTEKIYGLATMAGAVFFQYPDTGRAQLNKNHPLLRLCGHPGWNVLHKLKALYPLARSRGGSDVYRGVCVWGGDHSWSLKSIGQIVPFTRSRLVLFCAWTVPSVVNEMASRGETFHHRSQLVVREFCPCCH